MKIHVICLVLMSAVMADAGEAVYLMRGPVVPHAHEANGYAVGTHELADGIVEVRVETSMNPIGSFGSFAEIESGPRPSVPKGFELPPKLNSTLRPEMTAWEAATAVLRWVSNHLRLVENDRRPQDAVSVLNRRGGRCSGLANATAALLLAAGFEARTVSGLLITGREAIPHRWVECLLPGAGWVPTDPTLGWWTVTPRHVAFVDAVEQIPMIKVVVSSDGELHRLPRTGTTMIRPNQGAELVCRLGNPNDEKAAVAKLQRGGGSPPSGARP